MGTLKDLGELGIIHMLEELTREHTPGHMLGIGDDCAMFSFYDDAYNYLVTTDMLVEKVHFRLGQITPYQLGYKALAVNLSDIAAMGGVPIASFLSLSLPSRLDESWMKGFSEGYASISNRYHTSLLGGDTVGCVSDIVVNVIVLGKILKGLEKRRNAAQSGDLIVVSGTLGDAAAGRLIIDQRNRSMDSEAADVDQTYLVHRFYEPEPRLTLGEELALMQGVHAMMDLSDGLVSDLPHILRQSHVSATIQLDKLPISPELSKECVRRPRWKSETLAVSGGEDYELLFTIAPDALDQLPEPDRERGIPPLTVIGEITRDGDYSITWKRHSRTVQPDFRPFSHF